MRNPIFHDQTMFLDHAADGSIRYVTGDQTRLLSSGVKIMKLETRQPLVEIRTAAGHELIMAPETAFALAKSESGGLVRYAPVEPASGPLARPIDWQEDIENIEDRRFVLAGMMLASGNHIFNRNRASHIVLTDLDSAFEIKAFLTRVAAKYLADGEIHGLAAKVSMKETPDGYLIRARVLTMLVGNLLTEKVMVPTFSFSSVKKNLLGNFFRGIFLACQCLNDAVIIRHRHAEVVRTLAEHLLYRFGVSSTISIHPMEPIVQVSIAVPEGHYLQLSADQLDRAALTGLLVKAYQREVAYYSYDVIEKITPLSRKISSVIVLPGTGCPNPLTANGFVFRPEFEIPSGITEFASHPLLFEDSSDPASF
jgi:hypothetical protein